jgi:hypothetical protein
VEQAGEWLQVEQYLLAQLSNSMGPAVLNAGLRLACCPTSMLVSRDNSSNAVQAWQPSRYGSMKLVPMVSLLVKNLKFASILKMNLLAQTGTESDSNREQG